jgi:hypothetical protein
MLARPTLSLLVLTLLVALTLGAGASTDAPPLDALVGRISMSLGGPNGGAKKLDAAPAIELVFRRTVRDSHSSDEIIADHRYVELGERRRLDVRVIEGEGKDSAAVVDGDSWLIVDGAAHPVEREAAIAQMKEFDPRRLWSVPFALAAEGRQILQAASLEVVGRAEGADGRELLVMVGRDENGTETSRVEVMAKSYRPTNVQFNSSSGRVEYRYGDYREIADGLVVPFEREFLRNGTRVSLTRVVSLSLKPPADLATLFDRSATELGPVPAPKGAK